MILQKYYVLNDDNDKMSSCFAHNKIKNSFSLNWVLNVSHQNYASTNSRRKILFKIGMICKNNFIEIMILRINISTIVLNSQKKSVFPERYIMLGFNCHIC